MAAITVEDIILQQSHRGMDILRPLMADDFCRRAARHIYALPRGTVLLTTGFFVGGAAESDGPAGTACLALALQELGFACVILTDDWCRDYFEPLGLQVEYLPKDEAPSPSLLDRYAPVGLFSIERCGRNDNGDYANMRGVSIRTATAPIDDLFPAAAARGIFTLGIGDGGNEIGMGNVAATVRSDLSLVPCIVTVDDLIIASVSNWGAYGLAACLSVLEGRDLMQNGDWLESYLAKLAAMGCVDGVNREAVPTVDGYCLGTERHVLEELLAWERTALGQGSLL